MINRTVSTKSNTIEYNFRLSNNNTDANPSNSVDSITIRIQPDLKRISFILKGMHTRTFNDIINIGHNTTSKYHASTQKYYFHSLYFNIEEVNPWRFGTGLSLFFDNTCMMAFAEAGIRTDGQVQDIPSCIDYIKQTLHLLAKINTEAKTYADIVSETLANDEFILQSPWKPNATTLRM